MKHSMAVKKSPPGEGNPSKRENQKSPLKKETLVRGKSRHVCTMQLPVELGLGLSMSLDP